MTDITLEQRAQLAYETWRDTPADGDSAWPKWLAVAEAMRLSAGADCPKRLLGWRTGDYLYETTDRSQAINWLGNVEVLPIFEGDPNTKLDAAPRHETGEG